MKSILIVTEQFTVGGLETHIRGEVSQLIKKGIQVHLATGKNFNAELLPSGLSSLNHNIPLDPTATADELLIAINRLRQIIHEQLIDCIHVHPFTSIIPAVAAAELEAIPVAITLHGPASLISYGPLYDFLLKNIILPNSELIITVSPEMKRLASAYTDERSLNYIPNAISFTSAKELNTGPDEINPHWVIVSRLDQFKIHGVIDFCAKAKIVGISSILVVGDGPAKEELRQELEQRGLSNYVNLYGSSNQVQLLMKQSAGVAGMGRVILEGIACQKPVILVGYDGVKGVVDKALLELSADSNFSGRGLPVINAEDFLEQLKKNSDLDFSHLYDFAKNLLNEATVWSKFYDSIKAARPVKSTSISGLYLSLSGNPISGLIPYLRSIELLDRLGTVICGKKYYEPRLSAAVLFCRQRIESANFNQILAERDAQIATLNQTVTEQDAQNAALRRNLEMMRNSSSWRITAPLRTVKNLTSSSSRIVYRVIRSIFWRLPAGLRQVLHGPRHTFVRFVRRLSAPMTHQNQIAATTDLSWVAFQSEILSKREQYKGIFIQEFAIHWGAPLHQRPQHLATALGKLGYLVIYRTDDWSGDNVNGFREVCMNVWVTNRSEVNKIQDTVRSVYSTAHALSKDILVQNGKRDILIYEYIDHIDSEISGDQENINRLLDLKQFAFGGGADFIIASARKLYEEAVCAVGQDKVLLIPNGVDTAHYRDPAHQATLLPASLVEFKDRHKAIVGYFGALAPWLWYDCIRELVTMRSEIGFVFIGPDYYGGSTQLPAAKNVLYLGTVDYDILPAYARQFDLCFIPFKPGEIARTTSPLKLFEYFALEKPVVVTADMDECTAYPEVFRGNSALQLSQAIDNALKVKDQEVFKARLRALADQNDWTQRAHAIEACFNTLATRD